MLIKNVNNGVVSNPRACGSSAELQEVTGWWEAFPRAAAVLPSL